MIKLKPGFHMIAAIAEKKNFSDRRDIKRSISDIVVAAMAEEWFPYDRWTFFSQRSQRS